MDGTRIMRLMRPLKYGLLAVGMTLSACGSTTEERGISGAGIGAGAGAVIGALTGISVVQGALIGAAAGGLTGVATDESQVSLGDPIWKKESGSSTVQTTQPMPATTTQTAYAVAPDPQLVQRIQSGLYVLGYDIGPVDSKTGPRTRSMVRQYQADQGLLVDGRLTQELAAHIQQQARRAQVPTQN